MITSLTSKRFDRATIVRAISDLSGRVYWHWFIDGAYVGMTASSWKAFLFEPGEQVRVDVLDTNDLNFDAVANAPIGYPARRSLLWVPRGGTDVVEYRIRQKKDTDEFVDIGRIRHMPSRWLYRYLTPRLVDLSTYTWWIVPITRAGNEADPVVIGPELIVRTPDAPDFTASYDGGTGRFTFTEAA